MSRTFLFIPFGSHGDVHPILGLAVAMKERGHRVIVGTNGFFRELVECSGLEFIEYGTAEDYLRVTRNPAIWHATTGGRLILESLLEHMRPVYADLLRRWHQERFTLVASPLCLAARLIHETHGVPLISTQLQPLVMRSAHEVPGLPLPLPSWSPKWWIRAMFRLADAAAIDRTLCPRLNEFRHELGLAPISRPMNGWWNSPQRVIGLWPAWFAQPQPDWPPQVRLAGFPLYDERDITGMPTELEEFLAAGPAPIAFTPGSAMRNGRAFFDAAVGACELLGRRAVLLTRFTEHLPPQLPPSVMHVSFAPFSLLLPRCEALVHHGGIGTMAQGFAAGIPQLLMPMAHDQPDNLLRLQRLGIGDGLAPKRFTAAAVAAKLQPLLEDGRVAARCEKLQQLIDAAHPLATACELMEAPL